VLVPLVVVTVHSLVMGAEQIVPMFKMKLIQTNLTVSCNDAKTALVACLSVLKMSALKSGMRRCSVSLVRH
jgi:hypothetical protein